MKIPNINSDDLLKKPSCQPSILFIHSVDLTVGGKRCGNRPLGHSGSYSVGFVSGNHHLETPKPASDSFPFSLLDPKLVGEIKTVGAL